MKKSLLIIAVICLLCACQKGIHWDISSKGFLVKDAKGECLPVNIQGVLIADSVINNNNFITVDVNVTGIGTYNIFTDSINGYVFKASGNFDQTGVMHVKLSGSGKPLTAGIDYITIHYDTSTCQAAVTITTNIIPVASYTLHGTDGKCINDSVMGDYIEEQLLDSTHQIAVEVDVTTPGRYNITSNSVNGYAFTASGVFTTTGKQKIVLTASGKPQKKEKDVFEINADSSVCSVEVTVRGDDAIFTLQGAPGKCMNDSVMGTYVKGIGFDTLSKVTIMVNVTGTGNYNITTNTVNGYSFNGSGYFYQTGVQTVALQAAGVPINGGTDVFTVYTGTATCSFQVTVLTGVVNATSNDYIPLTTGNYWVYDDLHREGHQLTRTITGDSLIAGHTYKKMFEVTDYGDTKTYALQHDSINQYIDHARIDAFTASFLYAKAVFEDQVFMKQDVQKGTGWQSPEFKEVSTFNQVIYIQYYYSCLSTNNVITVNGKAFKDVAIIRMQPQIRADSNPWGATGEIFDYYYAKGIGLIYYRATNIGYITAELALSKWMVK